jgi:hypothetical protein
MSGYRIQMGLFYAGIIMMADQILLGGAFATHIVDGIGGLQRELRYEFMVMSLD